MLETNKEINTIPIIGNLYQFKIDYPVFILNGNSDVITIKKDKIVCCLGKYDLTVSESTKFLYDDKIILLYFSEYNVLEQIN